MAFRDPSEDEKRAVMTVPGEEVEQFFGLQRDAARQRIPAVDRIPPDERLAVKTLFDVNAESVGQTHCPGLATSPRSSVSCWATISKIPRRLDSSSMERT